MYEYGHFVGVEDAGSPTIAKRRPGDDIPISAWNEISHQRAATGYKTDVTTNVHGESCTVRMEAAIDNARDCKLITGTWTITGADQ